MHKQFHRVRFFFADIEIDLIFKAWRKLFKLYREKIPVPAEITFPLFEPLHQGL